MQICSIQSYTGRNIYSHKPVIKMVVNLQNLHDKQSKDIDGFADRILELFPGLIKHYCGLGYEGGFVERLQEGTYMGHIAEHLALELQNMLGYAVFYGKTRLISEPDLYYIVFTCVNEIVGMECGRAAVDIINKLTTNEIIDMGGLLKSLQKVKTESELGPSAKAIYDEAVKRGIPVMRIGNESLMQLGYGKYSRRIAASLSDASSCLSVDIAGNKHLVKEILSDNKIPVPRGDMAYTEEGAAAIAGNIGYPVVLKPLDGSQGRGVTLDIRNESQLRTAYHEAIKHSKAVIVENYVKGKDYRILVIGDKVSAVAERRPPTVTGDGMHTVNELVAAENENPLRGDDHEKPLTKIKLDATAKQVLLGQGLDEDAVPKQGQAVRLRDNGNLSTGGNARDCTREIHPYNSNIALRAAKAIGLDIAGIDMVTEDISVPINQSRGAIIEVNAAPGLRMHIYPTEGQSINVAGHIIDMMFPENQPSSIPIVAITGTNGKTTTTRLVRHCLSLAGYKVGMTSTSGIYIGNDCILKGDNTGPVSAKMVLSNKEVDAAVLETARGGIVKKGLGYDLADVGVIVNITEDHLGLDGLNTLEDLAYVKSLIVEAVKPKGYAVLNADDAMTNYLVEKVHCYKIFFSSRDNNTLVVNHIKNAGKAVYIHKNNIIIADGAKKTQLIGIDEIPITFKGLVECNIENSLAAVSALYSMNIPLEIIKMGLKTFKPDIMSNPGRFNIFNMGDFNVMLDYGHNPAGYNAVIKFARKMNADRLVGIIGVPGDRLDKNIREIGNLCSKVFNRIYIKEDNDLRGREQGEVAQILYNGVMEDGYKADNIKVIYSELEALETAMLDAQPGDLIIMLYEEFDPAVELINKFKKELEQTFIQPSIIAEETVV